MEPRSCNRSSKILPLSLLETDAIIHTGLNGSETFCSIIFGLKYIKFVMHRAVPVISKIVDRKWHERQHSRHQVRLRHMKPVTTVDPPAKPRFLETRAKKR